MSSAAPFKRPTEPASDDFGYSQADFDALLLEAVKKKQYAVVELALEQSASRFTQFPPYRPSDRPFGL